MHSLICKNCRKPFEARLAHRLHCSRECYQEYRYSAEHLSERFWSQVRKTDDCWLWIGYTLDTGYGQTYWPFEPCKGNIRAHRASYLLAHGSISVGLDVLHHCDTPLCVRPDHLYLGNDEDNHRDMMARGRSLHGEKSKKAKLSAEQVRAIRREYVFIHRRKTNQSELARKYGVGVGAINSIVHGRTWKRV